VPYKGAVTAVRSEYIHEPEEEDFLAVVEEEADRLSEIINEITDMFRIEPASCVYGSVNHECLT
jgi:hypothetical protein